MRLLRRALPVAMLVVLVAGLGGGWRLALSLDHPFPGAALTWRKELQMYTVSLATLNNWPGLAAGLHMNDRILCIDGYHPRLGAPVYGMDPRHADVRCPGGEKGYADVFRERFAGPDPTVEFLVDREGTILTVPGVPLVRFTPVMLAETFLPPFLLGLGLLIVGAIVYRANSAVQTNLLFALLTTQLAGLAMLQSYGVIISDQFENNIPLILLLTAPWFPVAGAVFFHLFGLFTDQQPLLTLNRWIRRPFYVVSCFFAIVTVLAYVLDAYPISYVLSPLAFQFIAVSGLFACFWSLTSLGWTWYRTPSRRLRHQCGLFLAGVLMTLGWLSPQLLYYFSNANTTQYSHSILFVGLGFVAVAAYAILRYQVFAARTGVLTLLLVAIWCILAANAVYVVFGPVTGFIPILMVALVVGLGLVLRRGPTAFFTRLLRREALDYMAVVRFGQRVGQLQGVDSLIQAARQSFRQDLDVERVDVWLLDEERQAIDRFRDGQTADVIALPAALAPHLGDHPAPIRDDAPAADQYRALLDDDAGRVVAWAPLVEHGRAVGLLGLGPRWTGEVYDDQDLQLVGILARQMALAILNTRQLERLQAMSRLIVQAEENERLKIARELHDTVLQFLLVLTYGLDGLKDQPGGIAAEVEGWQDRIHAEAGQLRNLLSYLRTPEVLVQQGLVPALHLWLDQARLGTDVSIQADLSPAVEEMLPVSTQVAVYRVFREAVHNALKHAGGSPIVARLQREGKGVGFSIADQGPGFDVTPAMQGGDKGYSSLQDMQTHIESVGGRLTIHSIPGAGTVVAGWVPGLRSSEGG